MIDTGKMHLSKLSLLSFRNYKKASLSFTEKGAAFSGYNGSGKTGILEAIHLLATGRSQRGAKKREMILFEENESCVEGCFKKEENEIPVAIGFSRDSRVVMKKNSVPVHSFSEFFGTCPIVSFGPQDHLLVYGEPENRRSFMDLFLCQTDHVYMEKSIMYKKNLEQRNMLLRQKNNDSILLDIYESALAETGEYIVQKREEFSKKISGALTRIHREVSGGRDVGDIAYKTRFVSTENKKDLFEKNRGRDFELGYTTLGPHRDDFSISVNNASVKMYGSQGQQRSMAVSLKLATLQLLEDTEKEGRIILVDDAFSDLDTGRTRMVFSQIQNKGQLFVTTLLPQHPFLQNLQPFAVESGTVRPV